MVAYTRYNEHEYGVTQDMLDRCDLYVIDPDGYRYLRNHTDGKRPIKSIFLKADGHTCASRMYERGDSYSDIGKRLLEDGVAFEDGLYRPDPPYDFLVDNSRISLHECAGQIYNLIIQTENET